MLQIAGHWLRHPLPFPFSQGATAPGCGQGLLMVKGSRSHPDTAQSVGLLWTSDRPVAETSTWQHTTLTTDRHPCSRAGFHLAIPSKRAAGGIGLAVYLLYPNCAVGLLGYFLYCLYYGLQHEGTGVRIPERKETFFLLPNC